MIPVTALNRSPHLSHVWPTAEPLARRSLQRASLSSQQISLPHDRPEARITPVETTRMVEQWRNSQCEHTGILKAYVSNDDTIKLQNNHGGKVRSYKTKYTKDVVEN